jgi:hypothetical protein
MISSGCIELPFASSRQLPLAVRWPETIVNTLCSVLVLLTVRWLALKLLALPRHLRKARHLCARCGYPAGTSPVCTECGRTLSSSEILSRPDQA